MAGGTAWEGHISAAAVAQLGGPGCPAAATHGGVRVPLELHPRSRGPSLQAQCAPLRRQQALFTRTISTATSSCGQGVDQHSERCQRASAYSDRLHPTCRYTRAEPARRLHRARRRDYPVGCDEMQQSEQPSGLAAAG